MGRIKMRGKEEEIRLRVDTLFKVNSLDSDQTEVEMPTGKARFKIKRKLNRKKKTKTKIQCSNRNRLDWCQRHRVCNGYKRGIDESIDFGWFSGNGCCCCPRNQGGSVNR